MVIMLIPLCAFFAQSFWHPLKKANAKFINKKVKIFEILSFEFALKRIVT